MPISPRLETSKIEGNWRHLHDSGKSRPPISQYFSDTTGNHGSHTNLVLAMPSPMEHCRPSWTLHGLNTDFKGTLSIYHAHIKTQAHKPAEKTMQILALRGRVGWRFYYLLPIAQWHSQARGATATSDSGLESDLEFLGLKRWLHAAPKKDGASYPTTGAEYLSSPTFHADSICVIRVLWTGWVLSRLNGRQEFLDCFGNQSGELQM